MALFDFLKRKEEVQKTREKAAKAEKKSEKKSEGTSVVPTAKQSRIRDSKAIGIKSKKAKGFSYEAIKEPHISEKATILGEQNKYVFKVFGSANKHEIAKSIQGIHGVDVLAVNIIKIPQKKRRIGRSMGFKKGHIKAVVTIKEGQKIEIF